MIAACQPNSQTTTPDRIGVYKGVIKHGSFSDEIQLELEKDSTDIRVFFTSLGLNASRIPLQDVDVRGDSIGFILRSDFYTFSFSNKWIDNHTALQGSLSVDTLTIPYTLERETGNKSNIPRSQELSFESNGLRIYGTIWYPDVKSNKGLVMITSSQNWDRSSSRAETILFAKKGYTTFHYDKRGTGSSEGDWTSATMEELLSDDINAIRYFRDKAGISLTNIGIKGSSQGEPKSHTY